MKRSTTGMAGTMRCSTADVTPSHRVMYWRDALDAMFPGMTIDWLGDKPPAASLGTCPLGDARVTTIRNTPARVSRRPDGGIDDVLHLVLQLSGQSRNRRGGHQTVQSPGDIILVDATQPFESESRDSLRLLIWSFPKQMLSPLLAEPGRAALSCIDGRSGAGAVLAAYACALAREAPNMDSAMAVSLCAQLANLTALVADASVPAIDRCRASWKTARRQQVLAYIETHFRDSGLTARRAARELGMSRRWLHGLLEDDDTGFAGRVIMRRIDECRRLLDDPALDRLSISEVAFRCGYAELSTFNRHFRARYGMTPRELRRTRSTMATQ